MGKTACLLLHGFTGGPYELEPLADHLQRSGRTCSVPVLPWNGNLLPKTGRVHWTDWVEAADEQARQMSPAGETFDLIGFSMGGMLAAYLASRYPVRKLVLLNAAVIYVSPGHFAREFTERWKRGDRSSIEKMRGTPIQAAWQFTRLVRHLKPELPKVKVPTFIAQSERDEVIHPQSARYIYGKLTGPRELHFFAKSNHLICLGPEAKDLFVRVERFLDKEGNE
jgi:esterase/lipase